MDLSFFKRKDVQIVLAIVGFSLVGFLIGHFTAGGSTKTTENSETIIYYDELIKDDDKTQFKYILDDVDSELIRNHLKYLTSIPHTAGTPGGKLSAEYVYDQWRKQGLDDVQIVDYDVLLSFPDDTIFNNVQIKNADSSLDKNYDIIEPTYDNDLDYKGIPKPFLAYALNGSATSDELYYANYGREEDFDFLKQNGINVTGKIVLCRYGKLFRGSKVYFGELNGAKGVLIFDDPKSSAPREANGYIYPNGEFLPKEGVQRGSVSLSTGGDPLTPGYPSTEYSYKIKEENSGLPKIPAQVIGYEVAYQLFKLIEHNSNEVIEDWRGDFNMSYTYGGKLQDGKSITLNVFNQRRIEKTYNVIGVIRGSVEPDQYVILGNHRDAWSYGAIDPSSGTSTILEVSRVLSNMKKNKNWRPKRSIIFASWDAEEFGLIGSIEWVEEFQKKLAANAVAYINLDSVVMGNYSYEAKSSPLLVDLIFDVCKSVNIDNETIFERWRKNDPNKDNTAPYVSTLASGSDFMPFIQRIGVPSIDQAFVRDSKNPLFKNVGFYATYHSSYETFNLISKYLDPTFRSFKLVAIISSEIARRLSDSLILPLNGLDYADELERIYKEFHKQNQQELDKLNISLDLLKLAVGNFSLSAHKFHQRLDILNKSEYHQIKVANEQLRNLERAFLDVSGYKRKNYLHMIYSPSMFNSYSSSLFPSISDAIYQYRKDTNNQTLIENIKIQLAIVTNSIQSASSILKDPLDFNRYIY